MLFRGYVSKPKIKDIQSRELTCKGEEDLLLRRYTGRYAFQAGVKSLYHAFQSDAPNQAADAYGITGNVGLLFMANSMIPFYGNVLTTGTPEYDWWAYGSDWIYKLVGLGTASRIGTKNIYAEGKLLPRVASFATMQATAISSWSDANDLWVRLDDAALYVGFGPRYVMLAENAYDTGIRQGQIDLPDTVITGNLQLSFDKILDSIIDLAEFYGLNPRFRRGRDYTYLDCLSEPAETEFMLEESNIAELTQSSASDQLVHALIGKGAGSRDVQMIYTPSDHTWKGIWLEDAIDVDDGYLDALGNLKPYVNAEYARRQADEMFTVVPTPDWGNYPQCNDLVRLKLIGESERLLQVSSAKIDSKGKYEMEIGSRDDDLIDAFNARDSLNRVYQNEYLVEYGKAITVSGTNLQLGDDTHGSCGGGTISVTVPADVKEADWSHRVTMDMSITSNAAPVSCHCWFSVGGAYNFLGQPRHYLLGDSVQGLDITRLVNYGSATTLGVWIAKNGEWSGANCAAHPTFDVSTTIRCWKRPIVGTPSKNLAKQAVKYCSWGSIWKYVQKMGGR